MKMTETYFISHGSPEMPSSDFLEGWEEKLCLKRPKSILVIGAHWVTDEPTVNSLLDSSLDITIDPSTNTKQVKYPAKGAPELAKRVQELLTKSGLVKQVNVDEKRGLDQSAWDPLFFMYPMANVPVCQLSVQAHLDGAYHYNIGRALSPLLEEGVLIIGSGSATHNMDALTTTTSGHGQLHSWAKDFDTWLEEALTSGRFEDVNNYEKKAPNAKMAHPTPEHFYPLHVAIGAAGEHAKAELFHRNWSKGIFSNASYKFTIPTN
uniref:stizolobate synthase n=1 Tax=Stegnosperma halimifolium TaxID=3535 RepID=A0A5B8X9M7_STEHA|nr:DODAa1 [Stegnosperma halimifolium]